MRDRIVRIGVTDHGPGIPDDFKERIFQKFAQANSSDTRQKGGTGLGLSIAKAIVERLGGRISYRTQSGVGTTFYVDLFAQLGPVGAASATQAASRTDEGNLRHVGPKRQPPHGRPRVLHIEDDADTRTVVAESISDVANVVAVSTAEQARDILLKESFDLVILDMLLPGENGDSVLRFLLDRSTPPPRVLVFSALDMAVDKWPPVTRALVKARTDIVTLRDHVVELLNGEPPPALQRSA